MANMNQFSDEELEKFAASSKSPDVSKISDAELEKMVNSPSQGSRPERIARGFSKHALFGAAPFVAGVAGGVAKTAQNLELKDLLRAARSAGFGMGEDDRSRFSELGNKFQEGFKEKKAYRQAKEAGLPMKDEVLGGLLAFAGTAPAMASRLAGTAGIAPKIAEGFRQGVAMGGANALGSAESFPEALEDMAAQGTLNAAFAGGPAMIGAAGKKMGSFAEKGGQWLSDRPLVSAGLGSLLGYGVGGKEGAAVGAILSPAGMKTASKFLSGTHSVAGPVGRALTGPMVQQALIQSTDNPLQQQIDRFQTLMGTREK